MLRAAGCSGETEPLARTRALLRPLPSTARRLVAIPSAPCDRSSACRPRTPPAAVFRRCLWVSGGKGAATGQPQALAREHREQRGDPALELRDEPRGKRRVRRVAEQLRAQRGTHGVGGQLRHQLTWAGSGAGTGR